MTKELTNIIQLIKAKEFELAYQLLIGNPWIYMECCIDDFNELFKAYKPEYKDIPLDHDDWIFTCPDRTSHIEYWSKYPNNIP